MASSIGPQVCPSKPVFTPQGMLLPTIPGEGADGGRRVRGWMEGTERQGWTLLGREGGQQPGSPEWVKLLQGPHPLPGRPGPPGKKNRLDVINEMLILIFLHLPGRGLGKPTPVLRPFSTHPEGPAPSSQLRLGNCGHSHPTRSHMLTGLEYFSPPPASLPPGCCSTCQPGNWESVLPQALPPGPCGHLRPR